MCPSTQPRELCSDDGGEGDARHGSHIPTSRVDADAGHGSSKLLADVKSCSKRPPAVAALELASRGPWSRIVELSVAYRSGWLSWIPLAPR